MEVVHIEKALKILRKIKAVNGISLDDTKGTDGRYSSLYILHAMEGCLSNPTDSVTNSSSELSQVERQDLQNKKTKLLSLLEEVFSDLKAQILASQVDKRY